MTGAPESLDAQGRSAFLEVSVPKAAAQRPIQLVGRLLRTTKDPGTVTILDRRIVMRRWGRLLTHSLRDFERVVETASERSRRRFSRRAARAHLKTAPSARQWTH